MKNADLKSLGRRIQNARRDAGISQTQLAHMLKKSKQLISHWETARSEITITDAVLVARIIGVDATWMITGIGSDGASGIRTRLPGGTLVPRPTSEELLEIAAGKKTLREIEERRMTQAPVSEGSFSFEIEDRAMEGRYRKGGWIVADPAVAPEPGECVIVALLASKELLFRRFRPTNPQQPIAAPFELYAENQGYADRAVRKADKPMFLGTVREYTERLDI